MGIKNSNADTLIWLNRNIGRKKWYVFLLVLLQIFLAVSGVILAFFFRDLIDKAVAGKKREFFYAIFVTTVLMIFRTVLNSLNYSLHEWGRSVIENQLKKGLFSDLLCKDYSSVISIHSGEWMNRLTSDTAVVANGVIEIIPGLTGVAVGMLGAVVDILCSRYSISKYVKYK